MQQQSLHCAQSLTMQVGNDDVTDVCYLNNAEQQWLLNTVALAMEWSQDQDGIKQQG